jgi:hydrogenase maturation protein HypF
LRGYVLNNGRGVEIEVEGNPDAISEFVRLVPRSLPPRAHIVSFQQEHLPPVHFADFTIRESISRDERTALISPDTAVCPDCFRELINPRDRRYRYPFINCTNCGPRYTIIDSLPYDRPNTSMKTFRMCPACREEYDDPSDRRFHAQPNACPICGPTVRLVDASNRPVSAADPVAECARLLRQGCIVAVKGLGGFHLAVDATNSASVERLRALKSREEKPLAVMAPDIETIKTFALISPEDEALLQSAAAPIVLLAKADNFPLSPLVAPHNPSVGVMLPYTPLHHLLLRGNFTALVMTSGNLKDEPIAIENDEALRRLGACADYFLMHDRDIYFRTDDSVIKTFPVGGIRKEVVTRRARGYTPQPIFLKEEVVPVLALGGEMKNAICLTRGKTAFLSQHIGEMGYRETYEHFLKTIDHLRRILTIEPRAIACDLHPGYATTGFADGQKELPVFKIQHHHAHIVSCLAENRVKERVIGIAFDGTGFGSDGTVWGGEFLIADYGSYERAAHLTPVPLPGGDQAVRKPWRMTLSYLTTFCGDCEYDDLEIISKQSARDKEMVLKLIQSGFNSPLTSSMGRLFDAVSALLGVCDESTYEGQAAMELEMAAAGGTEEYYDFLHQQQEESCAINPSPLLKGICADIKAGKPAGYISAKFHNSIAAMIVAVCRRLKERYRLDRVALSGGCFQNGYLLSQSISGLRQAGFTVLQHHLVPPNDGGIALGQALIANERIIKYTG